MVDKLDFIKISVCSVKDNVKRMKKTGVGWEEIFPNHIINKRFVTENIQRTLKTQQ